jgi:hypothetical protein
MVQGGESGFLFPRIHHVWLERAHAGEGRAAHRPFPVLYCARVKINVFHEQLMMHS